MEIANGRLAYVKTESGGVTQRKIERVFERDGETCVKLRMLSPVIPARYLRRNWKAAESAEPAPGTAAWPTIKRDYAILKG